MTATMTAEYVPGDRPFVFAHPHQLPRCEPYPFIFREPVTVTELEEHGFDILAPAIRINQATLFRPGINHVFFWVNARRYPTPESFLAEIERTGFRAPIMPWFEAPFLTKSSCIFFIHSFAGGTAPDYEPTMWAAVRVSRILVAAQPAYEYFVRHQEKKHQLPVVLTQNTQYGQRRERQTGTLESEWN